jgi:hypothetical protein
VSADPRWPGLRAPDLWQVEIDGNGEPSGYCTEAEATAARREEEVRLLAEWNADGNDGEYDGPEVLCNPVWIGDPRLSAAAPGTLYIVHCSSCGAIEGAPAGDAECPAPRWGTEDYPNDDELGHDWGGMLPWPLETCRVCGCTEIDCQGCIEKTGGPCSWVDELEDDSGPICSACVPAESRL